MTHKFPRAEVDAGLLLSPYGLATISYAFFFFTWVLPPSFYSAVMGEKDLLFLDPASFLLFTLCFVAFISGAWVVSAFFGAEFDLPAKLHLRVPAIVFLGLPLLIGIAVTVASIILLVRENPNIIELIAAQQGWQVKENMDIHQPLGLASIWLLGIFWWAMGRRRQAELSGFAERWLYRLLVTVAALSIVASAALKLARGELMPVLAGSVILYLLRRHSSRQLSNRSLLRIGVISCVAVVSLFIFVSILRGKEDLFNEVLAYSAASYNRMAALISGRLRYPHAGTGVYFSSFLSFNAGLQRFVPIADIMHWPSFQDMWESEFVATWNAGLNGYVLWSGTFGFLFSDFGWFTPIIVFLQGIVCGWSWRALKLGTISGFLLYPWFAFCVLFWFGTNFFFDTKMVVLVLASMVLSLYERITSEHAVRLKGRVPAYG